MTHMLSSLANGKLVVALEVHTLLRFFRHPHLNFTRCFFIQGGYSLDAISVSALAVAQVLLGELPPQLEPMVASEVATETLWQVAMEQSKYWNNVDPKACEPLEGLYWALFERIISNEGLFISLTDVEPITFSIPGIYLYPVSLHQPLLIESALELLKAHRQDYLFRTHGMVEVPLMSEALIQRFSTQVTCT